MIDLSTVDFDALNVSQMPLTLSNKKLSSVPLIFLLLGGVISVITLYIINKTNNNEQNK